MSARTRGAFKNSWHGSKRRDKAPCAAARIIRTVAARRMGNMDFRDVAQNRGVRVDFSEREAALRWLGVGLQP